MEAALAVLGFVGGFLDRAGDRYRARAVCVGQDRVRDLAVQEVKKDQLVELRDGDVARDPRAAVALGVGEEIPKVDVRKPRSRKEDAAVRKMEGGERRHFARAAALCGRVGRVLLELRFDE